MKNIFRSLGVVLASFLFVAGVLAANAFAKSLDAKSLIASLKGGGYVIVLRHGATNHDQ